MHQVTVAAGRDCAGYPVQYEEELVRRAGQGDQQAFAELYALYFDRVYRYAVSRLNRRFDAEDLTQQVFLKAMEAIGSYSWRGAPFAAWLFRIAHNLMVDHFRRDNKMRIVAIEELDWLSSDDPAAAVETKLVSEEVARAARGLTAAQQEVLSLRFGGGLSVAETSRAMGKSESAVKTLQHDALVKLRRLLSAGKRGE